jgi:hypothetical protein
MKAHPVLLLVVSFVLHPSAGQAAWQLNGTGVAIVAGDQGEPAIIPDGTGGTIITWEDARGSGYDIYAQRLNGAGVALWAPNGVVICSAPGDQYYSQIVPDDHGGAIVAWTDSRNGNLDIFAERVDGSGVLQWETAVALCTAAGNQTTYGMTPSLISDGSGGAIATWTDERTGNASSDIYAQRVNISGVVQWTVNGVALCVAGGGQSIPTIVSDTAGGAIVTWFDERNGSADQDIYAQRVNGSGVTQWFVNGVAVCSAVGNQQLPRTVPDGSGGVIAAWEDYRNGASDIYAQRLNASGVAQWISNGVALCTAPGYQHNPLPVPDGVGGAIVAWNDARSGTELDIYARRVTSSGIVQWTADGVALCTAPGDQFFLSRQDGIASDGSHGAFVTWEDQRNDVGDVYAQRVSGSGQVQLTPNGVAVCNAVNHQRLPEITSIGADAVVTWQDARSGDYDVYALPVSNTLIGTLVRYVPYPHGIIIAPDPHIWPVHLLFNNVIAPGFTYLDITPAGPSLPPSFVLGDGRYYNLSTTAGTTDNIQVCIKFDPAALQHPAAALRMFQYNVAGPAGPTWLDVTTGSAAGDSICGTTTHLSTFVIGWPSVTGVGDTPASFALDANVPNPFNPITTIHYDIPAPGADVNISIYDVSGRLIRSLVKERRGAGEWSVQWNGENDRGQSVASGVYFYRMRAGEFVETRKMMLLK